MVPVISDGPRSLSLAWGIGLISLRKGEAEVISLALPGLSYTPPRGGGVLPEVSEIRDFLRKISEIRTKFLSEIRNLVSKDAIGNVVFR